MSGHCVVLLISTVFDHYGTPRMFYFLWIIFGGLSGLKVVSLGLLASCAVLMYYFRLVYICAKPGHLKKVLYWVVLP